MMSRYLNGIYATIEPKNKIKKIFNFEFELNLTNNFIQTPQKMKEARPELNFRVN